jgi:hypothetical protein
MKFKNLPKDKTFFELTDIEKLNLITTKGNIIDFIVPRELRHKRIAYQVISSGKIKQFFDEEGNTCFYLPSEVLSSPMYKSIEELLNNIDWNSMEEKRKFNLELSN